MTESWRGDLWRQFGAAIDMLENALVACPEAHWGERDQWQAFWYLAFHTLFWLDLYLSPDSEGFGPPAPFGLEELDPAGLLPPRVYTKAELLAYLAHGRAKCLAALSGMTDEDARGPCGIRPGMSRGELHIYNLRHVQHGAAQLNLLLRQAVDSAPRWVSRGRSLD